MATTKEPKVGEDILVTMSNTIKVGEVASEAKVDIKIPRDCHPHLVEAVMDEARKSLRIQTGVPVKVE